MLSILSHARRSFDMQTLSMEIEACTWTVDNLASAGAQAEQHDMHLKLQALIDRQGAFEFLLREMYEKLISKPTFQLMS